MATIIVAVEPRSPECKRCESNCPIVIPIMIIEIVGTAYICMNEACARINPLQSNGVLATNLKLRMNLVKHLALL